MEALLVRFASERCLNDVQVDRLGAMRQAYQRLRESIEGTRRRSLSERKCSWHPEYIAMKALATETAVIAATSRTRRLGLVVRRPDARAAKKSLLMLTSNYYEARWITIGLEAAEEQHLLHPWDRERYGQPCTPGSRRN
jgi:hypothetical protein